MNAHDIWTRMAGQRECMLIDQDGPYLRARPMAPVTQEQDHAVWFVIDRRDAKGAEIARAPQVCLAFQDPSDHFYLSVSGAAEMVEAPSKIREIWTSDMEALYPGGPDDPHAGLLRVRPLRAESWQRSGALVRGLKTARAILMEERVDLGAGRKLAL